ncbi:MAG: hypothetical protein QOH67_4268 [Hyphomicrobiales bacterium]|jgi:hypothetical protein|nr:hypothetical protein [Hyphomicrobiales bacterium]
MRPITLAEAIERIRAGEPQDVALAEFVDSFSLAPDAGARYASIEQEPERTDDARLNALVAAMAEYLAKQHRLGGVPRWVSQPWRRLDEPWFTTSSTEPAMREYLASTSPAEFRSRNIFTDERPLRRARSHLPFAPRNAKSA